jgi:beta-ribofuranosylaminobenzene 5'-phosphate synthase
MTLLDMNGNLGNINGGLGFAVDFPHNLIHVRSARENRISWSNQAEKSFKAYLSQTATRVRALRHLGPSEIRVSESLPSHEGFGSFTSASLAVVEGLLAQTGLPHTRNDVISISRRGGTSGVGISSYFEGKMAVDLGHRVSDKRSSAQFLPSSYAWRRGPAMELVSIRVPRWPMLLVVPNTNALTEEQEKKFFRGVCPLPARDVASAVRLCFFGILPAVMTADYPRFCRMVRELRDTMWKNKEIALYQDKVVSIIQRAEEIGADAASMSSLGPLVYCFTRRSKLSRLRQRLEKEFDLSFAAIAYPRNKGRDMIVSS